VLSHGLGLIAFSLKLIENIGAPFLVRHPIRKLDSSISKAFIESACSQVCLERVKADGPAQLGMGMLEQQGAYAKAHMARQNIELIDPGVRFVF
jgi:hypothetical protein